MLDAWVSVDRTPEEAFNAVRDHIGGEWVGIVTTPWQPPYDVKIVFEDDGHYAARCIYSSACCIAFYYGTDDDCPEKRYSIDDATLSGNVTGTIDIGFGGGGECSLPAWQGELSAMAIDGANMRLRFDFETSDGYGPVHFELERSLDIR
jgi:hypothetical protein